MELNWSQETYIQAYRFAASAHNKQKFTGTDLPYLLHISFVCMEVQAALVIESARDGDLAIQCALLHDVIEDTEIRFEEIKGEFGLQVAHGVSALTKDRDLPKEEQLADSLKRIRQQPQEVWMVKLADRISNLLPPPAKWTERKIREYHAEARQINEALKDSSPYLADRLMLKMANYERYF